MEGVPKEKAGLGASAGFAAPNKNAGVELSPDLADWAGSKLNGVAVDSFAGLSVSPFAFSSPFALLNTSAD